MSNNVNTQVLARKYRPKKFDEFVGQVHVTKTLMNALKNNRLHHAFLFTGTRGVGKTTIARILAKCLNCQKKITPTPCDKCHSCQAINEGQSLDLIEFDAASRTKVEDMREVLENAQYLPSSSRYKIYLIDEVHMLSKNSFNALLKTLEEPPEHIKFLLATTDPHKLPITVLSRCLQFNLQKINTTDIEKQLEKLLKLEHIDYDKKSLFEIAKHGGGSMRDALSLLDQAIAYSNANLSIEKISQMLGLIEHNHIESLLNAITNQDANKILSLSDQLYQNGTNLLDTLYALLDAFYQLSIIKLIPSYQTNDLSSANLLNNAKQLSQIQIQLNYQIITDGIAKFNIISNEKQAFEMTLLRLLAFGQTKQTEHQKKK